MTRTQAKKLLKSYLGALLVTTGILAYLVTIAAIGTFVHPIAGGIALLLTVPVFNLPWENVLS